MMAKKRLSKKLDVAMFPLVDGRQVILPLQVLAEVQQLQPEDDGQSNQGQIDWRGYTLEIESLDALLGLPEPDRDDMTTYGVFKGQKTSARPFRALAFCGTPAQGRIEPSNLSPLRESKEEYFVGATRLGEQSYLIPDLPKLLAD
jgi:chemotaxis signal transduction protein